MLNDTYHFGQIKEGSPNYNPPGRPVTRVNKCEANEHEVGFATNCSNKFSRQLQSNLHMRHRSYATTSHKRPPIKKTKIFPVKS